VGMIITLEMVANIVVIEVDATLHLCLSGKSVLMLLNGSALFNVTKMKF